MVVNNKITMEWEDSSSERRSLLEGSTPEGWFFFKKNSERMFPKSESEMSADLFFVFE